MIEMKWPCQNIVKCDASTGLEKRWDVWKKYHSYVRFILLLIRNHHFARKINQNVAFSLNFSSGRMWAKRCVKTGFRHHVRHAACWSTDDIHSKWRYSTLTHQAQQSIVTSAYRYSLYYVLLRWLRLTFVAFNYNRYALIPIVTHTRSRPTNLDHEHHHPSLTISFDPSSD